MTIRRRARWEEITPFLAFSAPIRRAIHTTHAIASLNSTVRRAVTREVICQTIGRPPS